MKNCELFKSLKSIIVCCFWVFFAQCESWHCKLIGVADLLRNNPQINYLKCSSNTPFEYEKFSLVEQHYWHPYQGFFNETFVLSIPHGQVFGLDGWVVVGDTIIKELVWQNCFLSKEEYSRSKNNLIEKKNGRVAVIAQTGYTYYHHFLLEVLGKLALLEMHGVEYDYIYIPTNKSYMKEALVLWGIDPIKIIDASTNVTVQADELIVPSLVASAKTNGCPRLVHYIPTHILMYIREKLLHAFDTIKSEVQFSKKIFISRNDSSIRRIINEDDLFALFEAQGFQRYELSKISFLDGIKLFRDADIIAGAIGSGLSNIVFCKQSAMVIDIFQAHSSCTIGYIAQQLKLGYVAVKTQDFIEGDDGHYDTIVPLSIIKDVIKNL